MVCVSIQNSGAARIMEILRNVEMAEIRLDSCPLSEEEIAEVFGSDIPLIATCRIAGCDLQTAERRLLAAVKAGARFADLELEAPVSLGRRISRACAEWGTVLIRSYHDYEGAASADELRAVADRCRHSGGEIVKIVTAAHGPEDAERVLSLYNYYTADSLVAFAMGQEGGFSRIECLRRGAPFSYCCIDASEATAPGQMTYEDMYRAVYGSRPRIEAGPVRMPASKSYAQRAIVAAALAEGDSVLSGFSECDDSCAALRVAREMGAQASAAAAQDGSQTLTIRGIAAHTGCLEQGRLDVGESGLLARIMIPLASQLYRDGALVEGRGTLLSRPLQGAGTAMRRLEAEVRPHDAVPSAADNLDVVPSDAGNPAAVSLNVRSLEPGTAADPKDILMPVNVRGPLGAGKVTLDGSKSSQLVSGALMALPLGDRHSALSVMKPASIPYIYMTMDILRKFGVKVRSEMYGGRALLDEDWSKCTEILLKVKERQAYRAASFDIEGDWSAAAVFLAAGAVFGQVSLSGLDTTSLQADISMMDILMDAGASLSQMDEPKGVVTVTKAPLRAVKADLRNCPDLFPVTAVFCAFCQGQSSLKGVRRLSHKECDRAAAIAAMLEQAGVRVQIKGDEMIVHGQSLESRMLCGNMLKGGRYSSYHDHRMVMALRLAELGADSPVTIDDTACVAKSYPQFNDIWDEYIRK